MRWFGAIAICVVISSFLPISDIEAEGKRVEGGIWKYAVPADIQGEFEQYDPMGLIAGALIKTDCSMNWVADDGKVYCFTTGTSLVYFLRFPRTNVEKARAAWEKLDLSRAGTSG